MSDPLPILKQMTFEDFIESTSLTESQGGIEPCNLLDGHPNEKSFADRHLAHLSRSQEKRKDAQRVVDVLSHALEGLDISSASSVKTPSISTEDTSGPKCGGLSGTADLQRFLANKLEESMDLSGSPECELRWKQLDTLLGPPICQLRASGRRTSGSDCSGSLSATTTDTLLGWSTPTIQEAKNTAGESQEKRNTLPLNVQATLVGWPTPENHQRAASSDVAAKARESGSKVQFHLVDAAHLAVWPTPKANEVAQSHEAHEMGFFSLMEMAQLAGDPESSSVGTASIAGSVLNPAMSRWLMGFPQDPRTPGWDTCSPGWAEWELIQSLLAKYCAPQAETESVD